MSVIMTTRTLVWLVASLSSAVAMRRSNSSTSASSVAIEALRGFGFLTTLSGVKARSQMTTNTTATMSEAKNESATHSHATGRPSAVASAAPPSAGIATPAVTATTLSTRLRFLRAFSLIMPAATAPSAHTHGLEHEHERL